MTKEQHLGMKQSINCKTLTLKKKDQANKEKNPNKNPTTEATNQTRNLYQETEH